MNIPSTKKVPASNAMKKVMASARARINTGWTKRALDSNGSYIQDTAKETVSTVPSLSSTGLDSGPALQISNDAILAYLKRIYDSTKALGERVQAIERNHSIDVTPVRQRLHSHDGDSPNTFVLPAASTGHQNRHSLTFRDSAPEVIHPSDTNRQFHVQDPISQPLTLQGTAAAPQSLRDPDRVSILPGIDVLRRNPTVSQAVSSMLASYDAQIQNQVLQGKQASKCSGRYNTTDTTTALPKYRWPNEGYHGSKGKKRVIYDDLSLPQWAVGQLTNIHQIQDPTLLKQALLQVILALRDATSLPWQAVRDAWSHSMHDIEEGHLT